MTNAIYPEVLRQFALGAIDAEAVAWVVQPVGDGYVYDATHEHADEISDELGDAVNLTGVTVTVNGPYVDIDCDDAPPVNLTGLSDGADVAALVIYVNTGTPSTSTLAAYLDRRADTSPVAFDVDGTPKLSFPFGYFIRL